MATAKKSPITRADRDRFARTLRAFGWSPAYKIGRKNSNAAKGAVTRVFNAHRDIFNRTTTQPVKYTPYKSSKEKRLVSQILGPEARTPRGFLSQVPFGVDPKDYSLRVVGDELREEISGRATNVIIPMKTRDIVKREPSEVKKLIDDTIKRHRKLEARKLRQATLMVGPNEGNTFRVSEMGNYIRSLFFRTVIQGQRGKMSAEQFDDKFQLKLNYAPSKPAKKKKNSRRGPKRGKRKK